MTDITGTRQTLTVPYPELTRLQTVPGTRCMSRMTVWMNPSSGDAPNVKGRIPRFLASSPLITPISSIVLWVWRRVVVAIPPFIRYFLFRFKVYLEGRAGIISLPFVWGCGMIPADDPQSWPPVQCRSNATVGPRPGVVSARTPAPALRTGQALPAQGREGRSPCPPCRTQPLIGSAG